LTGEDEFFERGLPLRDSTTTALSPTEQAGVTVDHDQK
jgi:hypothetical protein